MLGISLRKRKQRLVKTCASILKIKELSVLYYSVLTGCDFVVAVTHELEFVALVESAILIDLSAQQVKLLLVQSDGIVLVVGLLVVDVVAHVVNFALPLLNGRVQLHRLLRRMLQVLLEVGHLA